MKRAVLCLALAFVAAGAFAQPASSFSFGPRVSSFSTDMDLDFATRLETGRQTAIGFVGDYRNGGLVLDWVYDHDSSDGANLTDIVADIGDYERNSGEVTVGYAVAPFLDLQGGVRLDSIRVGGARLLGGSLFEDEDIDHTGFAAGVHLHTRDHMPVGWYGTARGILGSAKFDDNFGDRVTSDTSGWRAETGIMIRIGESNWYLVPGAEYEHLKAKDFDVSWKTNRVFLSVVFSR